MREVSPEAKVESGLEEKLNSWREFAERAAEICAKLKSQPELAGEIEKIEKIEGYVKGVLDYIENPAGPDPEERLRNKTMAILAPLQLLRRQHSDSVDEETGRQIDLLKELVPRIR